MLGQEADAQPNDPAVEDRDRQARAEPPSSIGDLFRRDYRQGPPPFHEYQESTSIQAFTRSWSRAPWSLPM